MTSRFPISRLLPLPLFLALGGCPSSAPPTPPASPEGARLDDTEKARERAPGPCKPVFYGQLGEEQLSIAATDTDVYWQEYGYAQIDAQPIDGGKTRSVMKSTKEQHNTENMLISGDHLYWAGKESFALHRVPLTGGKPEKLRDISEEAGMPRKVAYAHDTLYVKTYDGHILWWQPSGQTGQLATYGAAVGDILGHEDTLYVGTEDGIYRSTSTEEPLARLQGSPFKVASLAISDGTLWWLSLPKFSDMEAAPMVLRRPLAGGEIVGLEIDTPYAVPLVPAPGGVYLGLGNIVWKLPNEGSERAAVGYTPANIFRMVAAGDGLIVVTRESSIHGLCPAGDVSLPEIAFGNINCPEGTRYYKRGGTNPTETCVDSEARTVGPTLSYYASGHVQEKSSVEGDVKIEEKYYANGKLWERKETRPDGSTLSIEYYITGQRRWVARNDSEGKYVGEPEYYLIDGTLVEE